MNKLLKAPLQEVIFELRWELDVDEKIRQQCDVGFELAQGKLHDLVKKDFPHHERRLPIGFPTELLNYQTVHQYWTSKQTWPVLQHGPGIFSVNDTEKNYEWESIYFPLILKAVDWLFEAYEQKLQLNFISLRYIDSINLKDYGYSDDLPRFVKENLKLDLRNNFKAPGHLDIFDINQFFTLEDDSTLNVSVTKGASSKTGEPALIWQTAILNKNNISKNEIKAWLERNHTITHDLFIEMTKEKLYDSFTQ